MCQRSKTLTVDRGYAHGTGLCHRPVETIQGYLTIATPGGLVEPNEEGQTYLIVKWLSDEVVRLVMKRGRVIPPCKH